MTEKIRRELIRKYTMVIFCILFAGFAASYIMYRNVGTSLLRDGLRDYLDEEVWEAERELQRGTLGAERHKVMSDIRSRHNFTYWLSDKKIIHAEHPYNDEVAKKLEQRLQGKKYKAGKIYHENIKIFSPEKQKWYFLLMKRELDRNTAQKVEVFVLANYTPVRKSTKAYVKIALSAAVIVLALAYVIGNFFVSRSMTYIEQSYQKQKQFVSDAAHEFRTPLTILYSYAELLEYNPDKTEVLACIKDEIQQIARFVFYANHRFFARVSVG